MQFSQGTVYFSGAGPGDPELITLKTQQLIHEADLILYAGSLVNPQIPAQAKKGASVLNTAGMDLNEQVRLMSQAAAKKQIIARLHTGDPSIYSAVREQSIELDKKGIPWVILPGVTAAFSAAAELGIEFTIPEICQSLVITRVGGKTPLPEAENLRSFAKHNCSLAIYLSSGMFDKIETALLESGYTPVTPTAIVYRTSWPDQKVVHCVLSELKVAAEKENITHQALVIISPSLGDRQIQRSHLYGSYQQKERDLTKTAVICLSADSVILGRTIHAGLPESDLFIPEKFTAETDDPQLICYAHGVRQILQESFAHYQALICIMASGIVVRALSTVLDNKKTDPAVLVCDNQGTHIISLLSGHVGGANALARKVAGITGGTAVITTASDTESIPALDILIKEKGWFIENPSFLTGTIEAMIDHNSLACICSRNVWEQNELSCFPWQRYDQEADIPQGTTHIVEICDEIRENSAHLILRPKTLVAGIGCNKGASMEEIESLFVTSLRSASFSIHAVSEVATIKEKAEEPGIQAFCRKYALPIHVISKEEILSQNEPPNPSIYAKRMFGIPGVAEPCAMAATKTNQVLIEKQKTANVTMAFARKGDL